LAASLASRRQWGGGSVAGRVEPLGCGFSRTEALSRRSAKSQSSHACETSRSTSRNWPRSSRWRSLSAFRQLYSNPRVAREKCLLRRRVAIVVSARMEGGWPMTLSTAVLRPGDWVHYDGSEHQVLGLALDRELLAVGELH
jgi:hypothetical protein